MVLALVAQAGTLPLTITLFNRFPTYFIISNIIIVPLASFLVIGGCLLLIMNPVHFVAESVAMLLNKITDIINLVTSKTASLPFSSVENIGMLPLQAIILTITIFLSSLYFFKKRNISILYPLFFLFLFVMSGTVTKLRTCQTNELIVYNTPGTSEIGIRTGKILNLYSDISEIRPEIIKHCASQHLKLVSHRLTEKTNYFVINGKKIVICNDPGTGLIININPDFIIVSTMGVTAHGALAGIKNSTIIFTPKASRGYNIPGNTGYSYQNNIHLVGKSGAFVKGI